MACISFTHLSGREVFPEDHTGPEVISLELSAPMLEEIIRAMVDAPFAGDQEAFNEAYRELSGAYHDITGREFI